MNERLTRARDVAREIQRDCDEDATKLDSTPFTPRGMGEAFGATLAMVAATARICEVLADEIAALQRTLDARTETTV